MSVQEARKSKTDTESEKCPVCNEEYTQLFLIKQITVIPDELQVKHCFEHTLMGIILYEHGEKEKEGVDIEIE